MRFMMIMFPKDYENAKPGWVPDLKSNGGNGQVQRATGESRRAARA